MPLSLPCPHCRVSLRLDEPLPVPDSAVRCPACGESVRVVYPDGLVDRLRDAGKAFAARGDAPSLATPDEPPVDFGPPRRRAASLPPVRPAPEAADEAPTIASRAPPPELPPTSLDVTTIDPRTPPPVPPTPHPVTDPSSTPWTDPRPRPPPRRRRWGRRLALAAGALLLLTPVAAFVGFRVLEAVYAGDLPSTEVLRAYRPATVTTVHAADGTLLGEIYEERRYVLPLEEIPKQVQDAFVAAEDAAFWDHDGIDYMGIVRAMGRNLKAGRVAQGGSTITQQVAKNFLLTSDRNITRKIKEAFLAWRIEEAYDKEHVLYLYLNEIFLGSQAYGVEAAARTFFGKGVAELSLAEAATIAGLPPRPSAWNPHTDLAAAKRRQGYVLDQMVAKGFVTAAEADAARAEELAVVPRGNTFREVAPHFTEYARRYLVERYGEQKVLADGLRAVTTCDLRLQAEAQGAVTDGVRTMDERLGFRRAAVEHLDGEAARSARREAHARALDEAGETALAPGSVREGLVLEVAPRWARVALGRHEGIVPLAWSTWVYPPNTDRSWRYRSQDDLTHAVDDDGDGTPDGGILRPGDVVQVEIAAASTRDDAVAKDFKGTPGADAALLALRLRQVPEVEAALLSFERSDDAAVSGAVRAMVGGADFSRSQLNRVVQSRRQVGSTFKPIVYTAALSTRKLTTASTVLDGPFIAMGGDEEVWKPSNYSDDYMGYITLRTALAMSRNTPTVRILDAVDPGMSEDVVWGFARALGIGGLPRHLLPEGAAPSPDTDHLCPWIPQQPKVRCPNATVAEDGTTLCRQCDLSIGLGSASLTMEELARAYAVLANRGRWIEPWYVDEVTDRDGNVLERHEAVEPVQVIPEDLASLAVWLLEAVATGGTGAEARRALGVHVAGKTGTTNEEKDAWFVGFTPDVVTAVWVGFDQPRSLGASSTGGRVALPIWIEYMQEALRDRTDRAFPLSSSLEWASIDEETGQRVAEGGRSYPFLEGTLPEATAYTPGQARLEDLATEL
ncbi:MAG: transglycosylase domain-containing protein [Alphaproteobacteria bacterium]|nr:transglycosylase domain-containing protein [Alphaproteobacteria bacterium]